MKNQSKIIAAMLAGVAAGAIIGLLLSPEDGGETRSDITAWFKDAYERSKEKTSDLAAKGLNAIKAGQPSDDNQIDHAESALGV